jgi:hypothetical protein
VSASFPADSQQLRGPVTVLIPVYNSADTLQVAARSALDQIGVDVRLLVVDDGSTDDSMSRLRDLADPRVRIAGIPHAGIAAALNHGYALIDTPYVARLDADDYSLPERLVRQLAYLEQHPELDGVGCAVQFFQIDPKLPSSFLRKPTSPAVFRWELFFGCPMAHSALLMRTEAWRWVGQLRDGMAEDYELYCRHADRLRLSNLAEAMVRLRSHAGQTTVTQAREQRRAMVEVVIGLVQRSLGRTITGEQATALLFPERLAELGSPIAVARAAIDLVEDAEACMSRRCLTPLDAAAIRIDATVRVRRLVYHALRVSRLGGAKLLPRWLRRRVFSG